MLDAPELYECKHQAIDLSNQVLRRAQDAGAVRKDITTDDLGNLTAAAAAAADRSDAADLSAFSRYLEILIDGLETALLTSRKSSAIILRHSGRGAAW